MEWAVNTTPRPALSTVKGFDPRNPQTAASRYTDWAIPTNEVYRGADKSLAPPGRKPATATEDFDVHISYL
jgi:hypothetical protein